MKKILTYDSDVTHIIDGKMNVDNDVRVLKEDMFSSPIDSEENLCYSRERLITFLQVVSTVSEKAKGKSELN